MKKIVALVDASQYAKSVCDHTAWIAETQETEIDLLYVLESLESATGMANLSGSIGLGARTALMEELAELDAKRAKLAQQQGRAVLEDANAILSAKGVDHAQEKLRLGNLIETVKVFEEDADLLVIGKRGDAADFEKMHLGSNLERVVRACTKPVLVTSRQFEPIRKCLIAFDGEETMVNAMADICNNPLYANTEITLLAISDSLTVEEQIKVDQALEDLKSAGRNASLSVKAGPPAKVISKEVEEGGFDLLGLSEDRRKFPLKLVLGAVGLQISFALALFGLPKLFGKSSAFENDGGVNPVIETLQEATKAGTKFVFGYLGDNSTFPVEAGSPGPIFVFQILPLVIVVASLSAMLWHWGILRWMTKAFAFIFTKTMGLGGATSLAVSANIFMGMTEAPVLVKPYLKHMSRSEIFVLMVTGFATIAGSVLVIYVSFLENVIANPLSQLLTASLMAAPAAVALAFVMVPERVTASERITEPEFKYQSTMDAFSRGATDGLSIVWNIATMLIAALALLYILNAMLQCFIRAIDSWVGVFAIDVANRYSLGRGAKGRFVNGR